MSLPELVRVLLGLLPRAKKITIDPLSGERSPRQKVSALNWMPDTCEADLFECIGRAQKSNAHV
jgi:hypothetical protein